MVNPGGKALAVLVSLVLAFGLCPLPASAATGGLAAATPLQQAPTPSGEGAHNPPSGFTPTGPARLHTQSDEGDFEVAETESGIAVTGYKGEGGDVVIPDSIAGKPVVALGEGAFLQKTAITSVSVPSSVATIGKGCFCDCTALASITLGEGVRQIDDYAFQGAAITKIDLPASIEVLGTESAALIFYDCMNLEQVSVAAGNAAYASGDGVLFSKAGDTLLYYPIGKPADTYAIPDSVTALAADAFYQNKTIGEVVIPASVTSIGEWCFSRSSITRAVIPATVTSMSFGPFDGCYWLTELVDASPAEMPYRFCEECIGLSSLTLADGMPNIGFRAFKGCQSLASVDIPASVTLIEQSAFFDCTALAQVTGASNVEKIEARAFYGTAISSFPWGGKLKYVSGLAFDGCKNFPNPDYPSYLVKSDSGAYRAFDDSYVLSGTANYKLADEVLAIVNQERAAKGEAALVMDSSLQAAAMKRACETSLFFSHTRPDGSDCFTADSAMSGENIAAGSSTAKGAMNQWMNSPGHRANILSSDYACIGVGCVKVGAITYWVQAFGAGTGSNTSAGSGSKAVSYKTNIDYETISLKGSGFNLNQSLKTPVALEAGKTLELSVDIRNAGWSRVYCPVDPATFKWTTSNASVATVSAKGVVTPEGKKGTATITAKTPGGKKWSIKVKSPGFKTLAKGATAKKGSVTYKVLNSSKRTVAFHKAPKSKASVKIPATVVLGGAPYTVTGISKGAFAGSKAKTVTVKTKKLTKKSVKGCFNKAKQVKTVKVAVGGKKANRSYVKKYKPLFKKGNSGAGVSVKAAK